MGTDATVVADIEALRFGVVFPTANADIRDFQQLLQRTRPAAVLDVVELAWPAQSAAALAELSDDDLATTVAALGEPSNIAEALESRSGVLAAVALAVTSASFLRTTGDHERQLITAVDVADCPATTTLRGFQGAVRCLGFRRVSVASVYPPHFTDRFIAHMEHSGARVVSRVDANARTDRDLARWGDDRILDLVARSAHPQADAVLLPETALHTDHLTAALEEVAAGVPVLTATQVTIWALYRTLTIDPTAAHAGPLFLPRATAQMGHTESLS